MTEPPGARWTMPCKSHYGTEVPVSESPHSWEYALLSFVRPPGDDDLKLQAAHEGRDVEVTIGVRAGFAEERAHRLRFLPMHAVPHFR